VVQLIIKFLSAAKNNGNTKYDKCHLNVSLEILICFFKLFLFKYKITLSVMQDSSHLTIILCSSVIKIVISQKQKVNRKKKYIIYVFQENNNKTLQDCT
jgi:hypothetical protein